MTRYEICVSDRSACDWADWFRELQIKTVTEDGQKIISQVFLTGWFPDQSAMLGVLMRLHNLNLIILSVRKVEEGISNDLEQAA